MLVQLVDVGADFKAVARGQAAGVDPRPGDHDHPQARDAVPGFGVGDDDLAQQVLADA